jgi:hypothetical protein
MSKKNFEDFTHELLPDGWKLKKDEEGTYHTSLLDEELDPVDVRFHGDWCAEIASMGYTHITLSASDLLRLADMVEKTQELYDKKK